MCKIKSYSKGNMNSLKYDDGSSNIDMLLDIRYGRLKVITQSHMAR